MSAPGDAPLRGAVPPAAVAAIVAAALVCGSLLGMKAGAASGIPSIGGALELQPPGTGSTGAGADRVAIDTLSAARAGGRRDLAAAATPAEQAAAALGLRVTHLRAASSCESSEPALATALRRNAAAYGGLARAAERGDRPAFARATTAVAAAERDLERLIGSVL